MIGEFWRGETEWPVTHGGWIWRGRERVTLDLRLLNLEGGEREPPTECDEDEREIGGLVRFVAASREGESERACAMRKRARCERCVC